MPIYPVPSNTYMGIHVTNTTDGNVIIGPNAEMTENFTYYGVPQENMDYLAKSASEIWPYIKKSDYIRNYSGILPKWVDENGTIQDFKIEIRPELAPHAVNLVGIESPGLSCAPAIGEYLAGMIEEKAGFGKNPNFNPVRKGIVKAARLNTEERAELIRKNPAYGAIVCRCETISEGEIVDAITRTLGARSMDGIKRRVRQGMGRCQAGFCTPRAMEILSRETGIPITEICKNRKGSEMIKGEEA